MPFETQYGMIDEVTYGTFLAPTRFLDYVPGESMKLDAGRLISKGLRTGLRVAREDKFVIVRRGAAGAIPFEVQSRGFGLMLKHIFGSVATSGPTDTTAYTHTFTIGTLAGKFFTLQLNKRDVASDTDRSFSYLGCKIDKAEFSVGVDELYMLKVDVDSRNEDTAQALASASYIANSELLSWAGANVTIGGTQVACRSAKITIDNVLNTGRRLLQATTLKKEPKEAGFRKVAFELELEFDSMTQYNRVASLTAAGALAAVVVSATGQVLITGAASTFPSLTLTIPSARFDGDTPTVSDTDLTTITLKGEAMTPAAGGSAITGVYVTGDVTP